MSGLLRQVSMPAIKLQARLLALVLGACLWAGPAFAGAITFIGTSTEVFGAGTSVTMNYPSSIAAGNFVAAFIAYGGAYNGTTCNDTQGNTWTNKGFAQGNFAAIVQTNWSFLTHAVTAIDSVTCTLLSGATGVLGHLGSWSNVGNLSSVNDYAGNGTTSSVTSLATSAPSGNSQCATGTTGCALILCDAMFQNTGTTSLDGAWTQLMWGAGANWATGYRIQANGTPNDCTGSNSAAGRIAIEQITFNSTSGGGATRKSPIMQSIP